jgi:ABC-type arginine/histidine transport system permease subunit
MRQLDKLKEARKLYTCCTIRRKSSTGEWRVNLKREYFGCEDTACYETELDAAIGTMRAMNRAVVERTVSVGLGRKEMLRITLPSGIEICCSDDPAESMQEALELESQWPLMDADERQEYIEACYTPWIAFYRASYLAVSSLHEQERKRRTERKLAEKKRR